MMTTMTEEEEAIATPPGILLHPPSPLTTDMTINMCWVCEVRMLSWLWLGSSAERMGRG